jgi:hypothetical protein
MFAGWKSFSVLNPDDHAIRSMLPSVTSSCCIRLGLDEHKVPGNITLDEYFFTPVCHSVSSLAICKEIAIVRICLSIAIGPMHLTPIGSSIFDPTFCTLSTTAYLASWKRAVTPWAFTAANLHPLLAPLSPASVTPLVALVPALKELTAVLVVGWKALVSSPTFAPFFFAEMLGGEFPAFVE